MSSLAGPPDLSVVVPVLDEEGAVEELVRQVRSALSGSGSWELVLVDDGSSDRTPLILADVAERDDRVRPVRLARRYGQSTAMQAGFDHARGRVIVTLDGDLQEDPSDIPRLVATLGQGYDLVVGYRVHRKDNLLVRRIPSWLANRLIRWLTGVPIRDNGCSLKAYSRELLDRLRLYSDMHRFIPALAVGVAGARLTEIPVRHRARATGVSKYGLSRVQRVLADLATIKMIRSFRDRPLALFTRFAAWSGLAGIAATVATLVAYSSFSARKAAAFVFPGIAILFFMLSGFLILSGLIAEHVVLTTSSTRKHSVLEPLER